MGDWTDLVGKLVDKATILDSNTERPQTTRNFAIPAAAGAPPDGATNLRGWNSQRHSLWDQSYIPARDIPLVGRLAALNHIKFGVSYKFWGRWQGKGAYIRDAYAWCDVISIGIANTYTVTCDWEAPSYEGPEDDPVATITAIMTVKWEQFTVEMFTHRWDITIKGNGGGSMVYQG